MRILDKKTSSADFACITNCSFHCLFFFHLKFTCLIKLTEGTERLFQQTLSIMSLKVMCDIEYCLTKTNCKLKQYLLEISNFSGILTLKELNSNSLCLFYQCAELFICKTSLNR